MIVFVKAYNTISRRCRPCILATVPGREGVTEYKCSNDLHHKPVWCISAQTELLVTYLIAYNETLATGP